MDDELTQGEFLRITLEEYLADRGRWSGSVLGMIEREPELAAEWFAGKDVDRPTAAKARGSVVHCQLLEGDEEFRRRFARFPNRAEGLTEEKAIPEGINPRTGEPYKTAKKTGRLIPQDDSDEGRRHKMRESSDFEKKFAREWRQAHAGKTIWYPEDEPLVTSMVKAARADPRVQKLLHMPGFAPEVTVHWSFEGTVRGERRRIPMRSRFDGLRINELRWVEVKTIVQKKGRLDTLNPKAVIEWCLGQRFHIKSAMNHDALRAATGHNGVGTWILIEATEHNPRISVIEDQCDSPMAELGRRGCADWKIRGYRQLAELGEEMRDTGDWRHDCTIDTIPGWNLPGALITAMSFEEDARGDDETTEVVRYG